MYLYTYIHMYVIIINFLKGHAIKENKEPYMGRFEGREERNVIIL